MLLSHHAPPSKPLRIITDLLPASVTFKTFWLVQGQSNGDGEVIVHISWHGKTHLHNLWSSQQISKCQESFWCTFKDNPMVRLLYTSADMEKHISINSDSVDGYWQVESYFWLVFLANPMVRPLYTRADMEIDISITSDTVDGFQSLRGNLGVVFQGQSNDEVTVHISWHGKRHLHNFWSSGWISKCQG